MEKVTRRSFLKLMGITTAVAVVAPSIIIEKPVELAPPPNAIPEGIDFLWNVEFSNIPNIGSVRLWADSLEIAKRDPPLIRGLYSNYSLYTMDRHQTIKIESRASLDKLKDISSWILNMAEPVYRFRNGQRSTDYRGDAIIRMMDREKNKLGEIYLRNAFPVTISSNMMYPYVSDSEVNNELNTHSKLNLEINYDHWEYLAEPGDNYLIRG